MKRILFATSEAVPFIKTGGLADVAGALPKCFDKRYFESSFILSIMNIISVDRSHMTVPHGILKNLHSSQRLYCLSFRLSVSARM